MALETAGSSRAVKGSRNLFPAFATPDAHEAEQLSIHKLTELSERIQGEGKTGRCCVAYQIPEADITIAARAGPTELLACANVDERSSVRLNYPKKSGRFGPKSANLSWCCTVNKLALINIGFEA